MSPTDSPGTGPVGGASKLTYSAFPHSREQLRNLEVLAVTKEELIDIERIKTAFGIEDIEFSVRSGAVAQPQVSPDAINAGWGRHGSAEARAWRETHALLARVGRVSTDLGNRVDRFFGGAGGSGD